MITDEILKSAELQRRLNLKTTATSVVVGLIMARLEEISPGSRELLRSQARTIVDEIAARGVESAEVIKDVSSAIDVMLGVSNT